MKKNVYPSFPTGRKVGRGRACEGDPLYLKFWVKLIIISNNNLPLIMVKTNRPTIHTVYNIYNILPRRAAMTRHTLSRRTAATTRFSPESTGCQIDQTDVAELCQQSDQQGLFLASIHQMAPPKRGRTHLKIALLLSYRPRKDKRLSWPSWFTCSGQFTHISGHPSAAGQA